MRSLRYVVHGSRCDRALRRVGERGKRLYAHPDGGRLYINERSYFAPVTDAVWRLRIGAYRVAHKWLDDRRRAGRMLGEDDERRYCDALARLGETCALMAMIDAALDAAGGVPGAFS